MKNLNFALFLVLALFSQSALAKQEVLVTNFPTIQDVKITNQPVVQKVEVVSQPEKSKISATFLIGLDEFEISSIGMDMTAPSYGGSVGRVVSISGAKSGSSFGGKIVRFYSSSDEKLEAFYDRLIKVYGKLPMRLTGISDPSNNGTAYFMSLDRPSSLVLYVTSP